MINKQESKIKKRVLLSVYLLILVLFIGYTIISTIAFNSGKPFTIFSCKVFPIQNTDVNGIEKGSAVFISEGKIQNYSAGDIIIYNDSKGVYRTARIMNIINNIEMKIIIKDDVRSVTPEISVNDIEGVADSKMPFLGNVMNFLNSVYAIILIVFIPLVIILVFSIRNIRKAKAGQNRLDSDFDFNFTLDDPDDGINEKGANNNYSGIANDNLKAESSEGFKGKNGSVFSEIKEKNEKLSQYRKSLSFDIGDEDENSIYNQPIDNSSLYTFGKEKNKGQYVNLFDTQPITLDNDDNDKIDFLSPENSYTLSNLEQHGIKTNITDDGLELIMENISSDSVMLKINRDGSGVSIATDAFEADIKISNKTKQISDNNSINSNR